MYALRMGNKPIGKPSGLVLAIHKQILREMGERRLSNRQLAELIGKSEKYVRVRVKNEAQFTLGDIDSMCTAWDIEPSTLILHAEQSRH